MFAKYVCVSLCVRACVFANASWWRPLVNSVSNFVDTGKLISHNWFLCGERSLEYLFHSVSM